MMTLLKMIALILRNPGSSDELGAVGLSIRKSSKAGTGFQLFLQPTRLLAAPGPGVFGLRRVSVFRRRRVGHLHRWRTQRGKFGFSCRRDLVGFAWAFSSAMRSSRFCSSIAWTSRLYSSMESAIYRRSPKAHAIQSRQDQPALDGNGASPMISFSDLQRKHAMS
jgi:hypothetical protein